MRAAQAFAAALVLAVGATGCGGGGGGSDSPYLSLQTPLIEASFVARNEPPTAYFQAGVSGIAPGTQGYISVSGGQDVLADARVVRFDVEALALDLPIRRDLPAGTYSSSLTVALCRDPSCGTPLAPPVTARLEIKVLPNVEIQPLVTLGRTGDEAAPSVVVPIVIPAAAGDLHITSLTSGIEAELVGSELHIRTSQLRAGVWEFGVGLSSLTDSRYHASTTVRYTVHPPAHGEHPMTLDVPALNVGLSSGDRVTRRVRVTPPTWLSAPVQARVGPYTGGWLSVTKVDDRTFDLTIDATGLPVGGIEGRVTFESGPQLGESAQAIVIVGVGAAVGLEQTPRLSFDEATTPASLRWTSPVVSFDGAPWRWTAVSDRPWLRMRRGSGTSGVDALDIELDAQRFSDDVPFEDMARITLSIDKPGSLPVVVAIPVTNRLPGVKLVAPGAIVGDRGRLFVSGHRLDSALFARGDLQVLGARVISATPRGDRRTPYDVNVFELEVDSATPGTPIELRIVRPALTTSVQVPVLPRASIAAGRVLLPDDSYGLPSFSARQSSWYFAGQDRVWRLHAGGPGWAVSSVSLPGVIDVDPLADETKLLAVGSRWVAHLDPLTLATTASAVPAADFWEARSIGGLRMTRHKILAHHVDGAAYATSSSDVRPLSFSSAHPTPTYTWEFGTFSNGPGAVGVVRSADHRRVAVHAWGVGGSGSIAQIEMEGYSRLGAFSRLVESFTPGPRLIGMAGTGPFTSLFDDGTVLSLGVTTSLPSLLPVTHAAAGYGLSADASRALIHAVRRQGTGPAEHASDALLLVVDLRPTPQVTATLPMSGAVGCLLPRAAAQPCDPGAAIVFEPQGRAALVIGRQAAEVVPLPEVVAVAGASSVAARSRRADVTRAVVGR